MNTIFLIVNLLLYYVISVTGQIDQLTTQLYDLTNPTTWKDITEYQVQVKSETERKWKICYSCGFPKMGTTIHYLYYGHNAPKPAAISVEYLLTRLVIIDVSSIVKSNSNLVLTLGDAFRWIPRTRDSHRPTLILFKFGWTEHPEYNQQTTCLCMIPERMETTLGTDPTASISYDLAAYIAVNMGHVVGVGTDTPSLESDETRHVPTKTVSGLLGKSGVYILENVNMTQKIPETGCLAMVMPMKLMYENYVPARVFAVCPPLQRDGVEILLAQGDTRMLRIPVIPPPLNGSTI